MRVVILPLRMRSARREPKDLCRLAPQDASWIGEGYGGYCKMVKYVYVQSNPKSSEYSEYALKHQMREISVVFCQLHCRELE